MEQLSRALSESECADCHNCQSLLHIQTHLNLLLQYSAFGVVEELEKHKVLLMMY